MAKPLKQEKEQKPPLMRPSGNKTPGFKPKADNDNPQAKPNNVLEQAAQNNQPKPTSNSAIPDDAAQQMQEQLAQKKK